MPVATEPISATSFETDGTTTRFYLVRPVVKMTTTSGTFYQSGRGAIIDIENNVYQEPKAGAQLTLEGNALRVAIEGNATLTIIDVLGRTIAEKTIDAHEAYDISALIAGAYIAQLRTASGIETLRFNK